MPYGYSETMCFWVLMGGGSGLGLNCAVLKIDLQGVTFLARSQYLPV